MSSLKHYFYFIIIYLSLICISLSNSGGPPDNIAEMSKKLEEAI